MQTFGRLRLDVENCVRELVDFGVARVDRGTPPRYVANGPTSEALAELLDTSSSAAPRSRTEDQSPSVQRFREMIGRDEKMLIVFEWIRTAAKSDISVLDSRPDRIGQGSRRPDDPRAEPPERRRSSRRSTARRCPTRCSSRKSSATRKARSPARTIASRGGWSWRTKARCSSTKSATCRSSRRRSCCGCSRSAGSNGWAGRNRSRSTSA